MRVKLLPRRCSKKYFCIHDGTICSIHGPRPHTSPIRRYKAKARLAAFKWIESSYNPPILMPAHFTEPTLHYWQDIVAPGHHLALEGPWRHGYPARLPDGRVLVLPIRQLASEPRHAVASLLVNQASLDVADALARMLAEVLRPFAPTLVIGLPTLGLTLAPLVGRALGQKRYLPLGYSRKFWYDEALSAPVHSITSPVPGKRIYLDPHLLPLMRGQRLAVVDDALSTGTTMAAAWDLIESLGGDVVACGVAMLQGRRWADKLGPDRLQRVVGVFDSPLLQAVPDGWVVRV